MVTVGITFHQIKKSKFVSRHHLPVFNLPYCKLNDDDDFTLMSPLYGCMEGEGNNDFNIIRAP